MRGLVTKIEEEPKSFPLFEGYYVSETKVVKLKTKEKTVSHVKKLLNPHLYTTDFKVFFKNNEEVSKLLEAIPLYGTEVVKDNSIIVYIEAKSDWDFQNMTRLFKLNQKWVFDKYKIIINLVTPKLITKKLGYDFGIKKRVKKGVNNDT